MHDDSSIPVLFLSWIPPTVTARRDPLTDGFAVSFSDGKVSIFHTNPPNYDFDQESLSVAHLAGPPIEVWYVAFSSTGHGVPSLFSGDDFGNLRVREFGVDGQWVDGEFPAQTREVSDQGKIHRAGITAILPLCSDRTGTTLLTGSYDECVRVYHFQNRGTVLAEKRMGGGVWRLKLLRTKVSSLGSPPSCQLRSQESLDVTEIQHHLVLASCMHAGARILRLTCSRRPIGEPCLGKWSIDVLAEFKEHESMNYASDIWRGIPMMDHENEGKHSSLVCVSSSFYDKKLCVWRVDI